MTMKKKIGRVNNNYIFMRLLNTFDLARHHDLTAKAFELGGWGDVSKSKVKGWRVHDEANPRHVHMPDEALIAFINGVQQLSIQEILIIKINDDE